MTGPKTNERPGTRAQLRYGRFSPYKAREVLDLIRGESVADARSILEFTERACAVPIGKVLDSAIANAEHNDGIGADELFVSACYADEGPTLKRFRPRARGRAGRVRKRTTHVTIIVSRYSAEELAIVRARVARSGGGATSAAAQRARRVARSRASKAAEEAPLEEPTTEEPTTEEPTVDTATEAEAPVEETTDEVVAEATESDTEAETADAAADEADVDEAASETEKDA